MAFGTFSKNFRPRRLTKPSLQFTNDSFETFYLRPECVFIVSRSSFIFCYLFMEVRYLCLMSRPNNIQLALQL